MRIKVCGASSPADIDLLAGLEVDFVGLWHGTGGRHDLTSTQVKGLVAHAAGRVQPVLVTLLHDPAALVQCGAEWVQLHAYQSPSMVRKLRAAGLRVIKVLHLRDGGCVEQPLIPAYERAGVDAFLLDAIAPDGQVGSTGHALDPAAVATLAQRVTRPFFLAGGLSAARPDIIPSGLFGIDVDTGARGDDGSISAERVAAITASWREST